MRKCVMLVAEIMLSDKGYMQDLINLAHILDRGLDFKIFCNEALRNVFHMNCINSEKIDIVSLDEQYHFVILGLPFGSTNSAGRLNHEHVIVKLMQSIKLPSNIICVYDSRDFRKFVDCVRVGDYVGIREHLSEKVLRLQQEYEDSPSHQSQLEY